MFMNTQIIFKRKIYNKLLEWKESAQGSEALLIQGARRVGKSTLAEEFAKNEYKSYIVLDFSKEGEEVFRLFDSMTDLDFFFLSLQQIKNVRLEERNSVIIFDEVQFCPKARQSIKFLVADGRYDYIETGSLISIRKNTHGILIPSEEQRIDMFPMDYEEFLWAIGKDVTYDLLHNQEKYWFSFDDSLNRTLMKELRLYFLIGGMPQAIVKYIQTNNIAEVDKIKRRILKLYFDDFEKIDPSGTLSEIFLSIPGELAKNKLRFEMGSILGNVPASLPSLLHEMNESMTVNFCYRCSDPNVGFGLHKDSASFKIYIGDTGLFVTLAFWDSDVSDNTIYSKILGDKLSVDMGYVFENLAAQMIRASGRTLYYYTWPQREDLKKHYEVDFLLTNHDKIIPVEVKSGGYRTHRSLDAFCEKFSERTLFPLMVYTKAPRRDANLKMIPFYLFPIILEKR